MQREGQGSSEGRVTLKGKECAALSKARSEESKFLSLCQKVHLFLPLLRSTAVSRVMTLADLQALVVINPVIEEPALNLVPLGASSAIEMLLDFVEGGRDIEDETLFHSYEHRAIWAKSV